MGKKFRNKDLAARLGVSGTLVSLVLNNKADQHGIRKDTQEKVLLLARQMGYFEALHDKDVTSPVEEKPGVIAMIVPSISDPSVIQISPYLQKSFADIGIGFSIITKDPDDQRFDRLVSGFKKFFSGLILFGEASDENTIRALRSTEYPFVILEKQIKTLRLNTVSTDISAGASLVARHIEKLGYKNIVIISEKKSLYSDEDSVQHVIDAIMVKPGMNRPVLVEISNTDARDDENYNNFERYLRPPYRADVMIIMKANLIYTVMTVLKKKKLRVPQDIAIVSMEDGPGFDLMLSPVTCLRKPLQSISMKVTNMIWTEVKNSGRGKFKRQVNVPPELVIRQSCGFV